MMNIKLIIGSITGIGALGGGVACCYYGFRREINTKQKNTPKPEATPSSEQSAPKTQNLESPKTMTPQDKSKPNTILEQPLQGEKTVKGADLSPSN